MSYRSTCCHNVLAASRRGLARYLAYLETAELWDDHMQHGKVAQEKLARQGRCDGTSQIVLSAACDQADSSWRVAAKRGDLGVRVHWCTSGRMLHHESTP
jgi:hypothetical protein